MNVRAARVVHVKVLALLLVREEHDSNELERRVHTRLRVRAVLDCPFELIEFMFHFNPHPIQITALEPESVRHGSCGLDSVNR